VSSQSDAYPVQHRKPLIHNVFDPRTSGPAPISARSAPGSPRKFPPPEQKFRLTGAEVAPGVVNRRSVGGSTVLLGSPGVVPSGCVAARMVRCAVCGWWGVATSAGMVSVGNGRSGTGVAGDWCLVVVGKSMVVGQRGFGICSPPNCAA
jgi:hypothetical protein